MPIYTTEASSPQHPSGYVCYIGPSLREARRVLLIIAKRAAFDEARITSWDILGRVRHWNTWAKPIVERTANYEAYLRAPLTERHKLNPQPAQAFHNDLANSGWPPPGQVQFPGHVPED